MFTSIFGKMYKRNPNLIDTYFTDKEFILIESKLKSIKGLLTKEELLFLYKPIE